MRDHRLRVFRTADVMTLARMSPFGATQALRRLAAQGLITRIKRGLWVNRILQDFHPFEAVPFLTAPWPSYVSLYSALAEAGVVDEIPEITYAVSSGRPDQQRTLVGVFFIHHLPTRLMWGYEMKMVGQGRYPLADPEKAFLDLVYLALVPRSSLGFPHKRGSRWELDLVKLKTYALRFNYPRLLEFLKENRLWKG
ncbi:MAG: type IV toxin-antitoxin system AbiEi family antitoxin domain-containing protein [Elusimicrobia bacterium]|nr:type IV toxin-antitoxin system AbiEi family antitoxin domain-containing protein [Elusimicrobiota bacterium]